MSSKSANPEVVFALYRPHAGKADELTMLVRRHHPTLTRIGLATRRAPVISAAADGTMIEVFEWTDAKASERAHSNPEVAELWEAMGAIADFVTLADLPESRERFPHFRPAG